MRQRPSYSGEAFIAFKPSEEVSERLDWPPSADDSVVIETALPFEYVEALWRTSDQRTSSFVVSVDLEVVDDLPDDYASNWPASPTRGLVFACPEVDWTYRWLLEGPWQETPRAETRTASLAALKSFLRMWDNRADGVDPTNTRLEVDSSEPVDLPSLEEVLEPDQLRLQYLIRECERLLEVVADLREQGVWQSSPSIDADVDVLLRSLRNEMYPPTGRPQMIGTITGSVLQLSRYVLTAVEMRADASPEVARAASWVASYLVFPLLSAEGTRDLPRVALEATEALGQVALWNVSPEGMPSSAAQALRIVQATVDPSAPGFVGRAIFGGREIGALAVAVSDSIGPVRNFGAVGVILGGLTGTAVSAGLGLPAVPAIQSGGLIGSTAGGSVGVIVGTVVAVLAARFRWAEEGDAP